MKIALIPLDERPANTRYPVMVGAIAGVEVLVPPPEALSRLREPADHAALLDWLHGLPADVEGLIVSLDQLGYGGLIASRISHEPAATILARLETTLTAARPRFRHIYGVNVITRISRYDDNTEEPDYWAEYGTSLFRLSQRWDEPSEGDEAGSIAVGATDEAVPDAVVSDFLGRRHRNHIVNLAALDLLKRGLLDLLVVSSDDTSPRGLSSREKRWLRETAERLGLDANRLLMYPGADEVGCVLLARWLVRQVSGRVPNADVLLTLPDAGSRIAPFEDVPILETCTRQLEAAGIRVNTPPERSDFTLVVNPPLAHAGEWVRAYTPDEDAERVAAMSAGLAQAAALQRDGRQIAIADVAHANGADETFTQGLLEQVSLRHLAGYGAWNTAGNTLGTVIAQAAATLYIRDEAGQVAHERLLVQRLVEDWAYMRHVRERLRDTLKRETGRRELTPDRIGWAQTLTETALSERLAALPGLGERWQIAAGSVRFPWGRTFEVDFDVERR